MMASQKSRRGGLIWAVGGGLVLLVGVIAVIVTAIASQPELTTTPTTSSAPSSTTPAPTGTPLGDVEFVDPSASDRGWAPEPITTDPELYIRAALEAAATFDTTKSSRDEWLTYLDAWFTPDTRYDESDRASRMQSAQLELRQGVVLPQQDWDSLTKEDGRVSARSTGDVALVPVAEDPSGLMSIGTTDVTLTFTRSDGNDGEVSYDEMVRVSVQVLCGGESVPTPNTAQQAGDCKVVRYFTEPLEP